MAPRKNKWTSKWHPFPVSDTQSVVSSEHTQYSDSNSTGPQSQYEGRLGNFEFYIPDEIKCTLCDVPKGIRGFSEAQQDKYRTTRGKHQMICMQCVCSQDPTELKCDLCSKTMPLEKFARSKRGRRGKQECYKCVESLTGANSIASAKEGDGDERMDEDQSVWSESTANADSSSTRAGSNMGESTLQKQPESITVQRRRVVEEERYDRGEDWEIPSDDSDVEVESSDSEGWYDPNCPF